jgi:hypothetical protein
MEIEKVYSDHIFIFPFKWTIGEKNKNIKDKLNFEKVKEKINNDKNWIEEYFENETEDEYNIDKYFYDYAKKILFNTKDSYENQNLVKNYKYDFCIGDYEIYVKEKVYKLNLKKIELKMYKTGIGFLIYYLSNSNYVLLNEINEINDFGRRIYPQYLPIEKTKKSFLAKELKIKFCNKEIVEEFSVKSGRISKTVMDILGNNFSENFDKNKLINIKPIIDDRMYTLCHLRLNDFSEILKTNEKDTYNYLNNIKWNSYIFLDNDYSTTQDKDKLFIDNKKYTYNRWTDYGTLFGITRYSFMIISDDSEFSNEVLNKHFINLYKNFSIIALLQRSTILRFLDETSIIASYNEKNNYLKEFEELNIRYMEFKNKMYFDEITPQEQGIEIFDMMENIMGISYKIEKLGKNIEELYNNSVLKNQEKRNKYIAIITVLGTLLTFFNLLEIEYSKIVSIKLLDNYNDIINYIVFSFLTILLFFSGVFIFKKIEKKRDKILFLIIYVLFLISYILLKIIKGDII